jgi:hypothetical protein
MWVMTTDGFYSAVQKHGDDKLTIRARDRDDLVTLQSKLPAGYKITDGGGTDYPARIKNVTHQDWSDFLATEANSIDYDNFKSAVKARRGAKHAHAFGKCWNALLSLEAVTPRRKRSGYQDRGPSLPSGIFDD